MEAEDTHEHSLFKQKIKKYIKKIINFLILMLHRNFFLTLIISLLYIIDFLARSYNLKVYIENVNKVLGIDVVQIILKIFSNNYISLAIATATVSIIILLRLIYRMRMEKQEKRIKVNIAILSYECFLLLIGLIYYLLKKKILFISMVIIIILHTIYALLKLYYLKKHVETYFDRTKEYLGMIIFLIIFLIDLLLPTISINSNIISSNLAKISTIVGYLGINSFSFFIDTSSKNSLENAIEDGFWGFSKNDLLISINSETVFLTSEIMMICQYLLVFIVLITVIFQRMLFLSTFALLIYSIIEKIKCNAFTSVIKIHSEKIKGVEKIYEDYFEKNDIYRINPLEQLFIYMRTCLKDNINTSEMNRAVDYACKEILKMDDTKILERLVYDAYQRCENIKCIDEIISILFIRMSRMRKYNFQSNKEEDKNKGDTIYNFFVYVYLKLVIFQMDEDIMKKIIKKIYCLDLYNRIEFINIFTWLYGLYVYKKHIFNPDVTASTELSKCLTMMKELFFVDNIDKSETIFDMQQIREEYNEEGILQSIYLSDSFIVRNQIILETYFSKILIGDSI